MIANDLVGEGYFLYIYSSYDLKKKRILQVKTTICAKDLKQKIASEAETQSAEDSAVKRKAREIGRN